MGQIRPSIKKLTNEEYQYKCVWFLYIVYHTLNLTWRTLRSLLKVLGLLVVLGNGLRIYVVQGQLTINLFCHLGVRTCCSWKCLQVRLRGKHLFCLNKIPSFFVFWQHKQKYVDESIYHEEQGEMFSVCLILKERKLDRGRNTCSSSLRSHDGAAAPWAWDQRVNLSRLICSVFIQQFVYSLLLCFCHYGTICKSMWQYFSHFSSFVILMSFWMTLKWLFCF